MKIDDIINFLKNDLDISDYPEHREYFADELEEIKELLKISRDTLAYGREESIKNRLIDDISMCLG